MNSLTSQDFKSGVNWDAISVGTFANIKQTVESGKPMQPLGDGVTHGIGLIIYSTDVQPPGTVILFNPDVPNPEESSNFNKWKFYIWARCPHPASGATRITMYAWNPSKASDPTLLKWVDTSADLTALLALAASSNATATTALETASNALDAASDAAGSAATALTHSNDALTAANTAQANANTANTSSAAAVAQSTAATNAASAAQITANNATAAAAANKPITQITPGTAGQRIRSNSTGSALQYYLEEDQITRVSNFQTQTAVNVAGGQGGGTATSGAWRDLVVNQIDRDTGNQLSAGIAGNAIPLKTGVYRVTIQVAYNSLSGFQVRLYDNTNTVPLIRSMTLTTTDGGVLQLEGVVVLTSNTSLKVQYQVGANNASQNALGQGAPYDADAFGNVTNRYLTAEFCRIN